MNPGNGLLTGMESTGQLLLSNNTLQLDDLGNVVVGQARVMSDRMFASCFGLSVLGIDAPANLAAVVKIATGGQRRPLCRQRRQRRSHAR